MSDKNHSEDAQSPSNVKLFPSTEKIEEGKRDMQTGLLALKKGAILFGTTLASMALERGAEAIARTLAHTGENLVKRMRRRFA